MPRGPIPQMRNMFQTLGKLEPEIFGVMIAATVIVGLLRTGLLSTSWGRINARILELIKAPGLNYYCLIIGTLGASLLRHYRMNFDEECECFNEFSLQNRSAFEFVVYVAFITSFSLINTRCTMAYGRYLFNLMESKLLNTTHSAIWGLLGFTMSYFANAIWFYVARFSAEASLDNDIKTSKNNVTASDFAGSCAPIILTGILLVTGNLMRYWENGQRNPRSLHSES